MIKVFRDKIRQTQDQLLIIYGLIRQSRLSSFLTLAERAGIGGETEMNQFLYIL